MKKYRAFVSCSFSPSERSIISWFVSKAEAFGLQCYLANEKTVQPPVDKVVEAIAERDCLIAILPQERTTWIDSEMGMAIALGKPVVAFYEEGVEPSGPYRTIADYIQYRRDALDESIHDVIQLINSLLRTLDARVLEKPDDVDGGRLVSSEEEIQRKLIALLSSTTDSLQIWAYSTETFLRDGFMAALMRRSDIRTRVLVRDPESDGKKGPVIAGQLAAVQAALGVSRIRFSIHVYPTDPMFRCAIFDGTVAMIGLYRWVPDTYFEFIGAENNSLIEMTRDSRAGKLWIDLVNSRFEHCWNRQSKAWRLPDALGAAGE